MLEVGRIGVFSILLTFLLWLENALADPDAMLIFKQEEEKVKEMICLFCWFS